MSDRIRSSARGCPGTVGRQAATAIGRLVVVVAALSGCGRSDPPATVEGTLRLRGIPLDNCLITFLPEPGQEGRPRPAAAMSDPSGHYRLRRDNQAGASTGWHRVTIQDLSVSTGVHRRDNGTVDAEPLASPPPPFRPSRVPDPYASASGTPLRHEVRQGSQKIDLEIP